MADTERLPPPTGRTKDQDAAITAFVASRGGPPFGPFGPLLHSPELMTRAEQMGQYLRYHSALAPPLSELAILITSRIWNQGVEWSIHAPVAINAGVPAAAVDAIGKGHKPKSLSGDQAVVYDFCTELHRDKTVSDKTFARAKAAFGEKGLMDLAGICGYYTLLAMAMNVAGTPPTDPKGPALPKL
jgi:4-carboxymuconolactone decarboxylase